MIRFSCDVSQAPNKAEGGPAGRDEYDRMRHDSWGITLVGSGQGHLQCQDGLIETNHFIIPPVDN